MGSNKNKTPEYSPPFFGSANVDAEGRVTSRDRIKGYTDITDRYANQGYYIEIEYLHGDPSVNKVAFKSFITDFQDNYTSNWNSEEVYGRPDPIHTFQNTTRTITLSWDVPSSDFIEAEANVAKASKMMRFLYPSYTQEGNASTMTKPPLLRLRFTNLVKKSDTQGLLGKASGFSFTPDLEAGWWDGNPVTKTQGELYPKVLKFTCEFSVIHEHHLGWHDCDGKWEVVCGEDGLPTMDENKMGWPYMPFGTSAGEILGQSPLLQELLDFLSEPLPSGRIADVEPADVSKVEKSSIGAQGVNSSEEAKAVKATNPTPSDEPAALPNQEDEARLQGALDSLNTWSS